MMRVEVSILQDITRPCVNMTRPCLFQSLTHERVLAEDRSNLTFGVSHGRVPVLLYFGQFFLRFEVSFLFSYIFLVF